MSKHAREVLRAQPKPPGFYDMVRHLTRPHQHEEPYLSEIGYWVGQGTADARFVVRTSWPGRHISEVPALVYQLLGAAPSGVLDQMGATFGSRPAARIEPLDTVMLIDAEAGEWVDRLGGVIPADRCVEVSRSRPAMGPICQRCTHRSCVAIRRGAYVERRPVQGSGTILTIQRLGGLYPSTKRCGNSKGKRDKDTGTWCCPRHQLEHDVRRWWHQARIITGWDVSAFKPHNTCPVCDQWDTLRCRIDAALCIECRSIWDGPDEIGVLARHMKAENGDVA